jgi:phosphoglycolate phosphatase
MKNAVIFDLDGTLMNPLDDLCDSTNYALTSCGFPTRTYEEVRSFVGNGIRLLIERAVPSGTEKEKVDECFNTFKAYYLTHSKIKTAPYNGVVDLLKILKEQGYKTAIVSNKIQAGVDELVEEMFNGLVDIAVGERAGYRTKPDPDLVNIAIDYLDIDKKNAVYVGDSDVDVMTAKNSNLDMVAVTWGFRDKPYLIEQGATIFIDEPSQLVSVLEKEW